MGDRTVTKEGEACVQCVYSNDKGQEFNFSTCEDTNSTDRTGPWCCTEVGSDFAYIDNPSKWGYCFVGLPTAAPTKAPTPVPTSFDCVGEWGNWGKCSKTCGQGVKKRLYKILQPETTGIGLPCLAANKPVKKRCKMPDCPTPPPTVQACGVASDNTKYAKNTRSIDRQCQRKCNYQSRRRQNLQKKCKSTCSKCNEFCSCAAIGTKKKQKHKARKGKGAKYNKQ